MNAFLQMLFFKSTKWGVLTLHNVIFLPVVIFVVNNFFLIPSIDDWLNFMLVPHIWLVFFWIGYILYRVKSR